MAVSNTNAITYAELTDEHIVDIKKNLEMFVPSEEYWDKFVHHSTVPRGHKTYQSRILIAPKVKESDISARAEFVAPRPSKIAVKTVERTVQSYGDKAIYSREDLQFHFDDTVKSATATLKEIAVQKLDFIKGKPFVSSRAIVTPVVVSGNASILKTAEKAAIIFRKNKVKRWEDGLYLAHITPELLSTLRGEIEAKGSSLSEPVKKELDGRTYEYFRYGDFYYSITSQDLMYKSATVQYIVFMGKRNVDGESPVDVAKLQGESNIEVINNPLGSGVLVDVDGNYTADDNKQQGSIAINMDGLGACISDDLCILDCEFTLDAINDYVYENNDHPSFDLTGNKDMTVSKSGRGMDYGQWTISKSAGSNTAITLTGVDASSKAYSGAVVVATVAAADGYHFADNVPTKANWTATYDSTKAAKILSYLDGNKTIVVEVPNGDVTTKTLTIACAATGTANA